MPRKKKVETTDEPISVLQPEMETEGQESGHAIAVEELELEPEQIPTTATTTESLEAESCSRDFLTASLQSTTASISHLFEKQAELQGTQAADAFFDSFESAFINRIEKRLEPFINVFVPEIKDSHTQLKERTTARLERRQSVFDRLKQITSAITDECKLLLPSNEVTVIGEFINWEPINKEDE
jgi:hypothetical protein